VRSALSAAAARLAVAGSETPRLDAELLLGFALGCDRARLVIDAASPVAADALERFELLVARREGSEPVAYLVGRRAFRGIELAVDPRVLIPRPETELLVEAALGLPLGTRVADVGTGSGAVALALAAERPDLRVTGIDVSADALAVARANAVRLGLDVHFVCADLLDGGRYDAVVANLPYVAMDGPALPATVAAFEPAQALYGGGDGLSEIRRLVGRLPGVPWVALEVGFDQAAPVSALLREAGFGRVERLRDLAGHERVVLARP
jgi:release factor glutamine methyltransferase